MPPKGYQQGQLTLAQVALDEEGRISACPQGHAPASTQLRSRRLEVRFAAVPCESCPLRKRCPGTTRSLTDKRWPYTHERVQGRKRRLAEQRPEFKERYRWRAGIEATMSRLKHQMRLAHLRVRGMAAVRYTVFLRALGLNIFRVAAVIRAH